MAQSRELKLNEFLREINARELYRTREGKYKMYSANGHTFIVVSFGAEGWDIYMPSASNDIDTTLMNVRKYVEQESR